MQTHYGHIAAITFLPSSDPDEETQCIVPLVYRGPSALRGIGARTVTWLHNNLFCRGIIENEHGQRCFHACRSGRRAWQKLLVDQISKVPMLMPELIQGSLAFIKTLTCSCHSDKTNAVCRHLLLAANDRLVQPEESVRAGELRSKRRIC
jgi:hypothetical protein